MISTTTRIPMNNTRNKPPIEPGGSVYGSCTTLFTNICCVKISALGRSYIWSKIHIFHRTTSLIHSLVLFTNTKFQGKRCGCNFYRISTDKLRNCRKYGMPFHLQNTMFNLIDLQKMLRMNKSYTY